MPLLNIIEKTNFYGITIKNYAKLNWFQPITFKISIMPLLLHLNYPKSVEIIGWHKYLEMLKCHSQQKHNSFPKRHTLTVPTYFAIIAIEAKYFFWVQSNGITTIKMQISTAFKPACLFEDISVQIISKPWKIWTEKICSWRNWQERNGFVYK